MSSSEWFSAAVRVAILVEGTRDHDEARSVFLFRSPNFDEAFVRALQLGRGLEQEYVNGAGQLVRWLLLEVETLDILGPEIADGREVYSEPLRASITFPPETSPESFKPEESNPTSSGV